MTIPITCAGCQTAFDVPDTLAGKTIRCTSCKAQMAVPAAGAPAKPAFGSGGAAALPLPDDTPPPKKAPPPKPAAKKPAAVVEADDDDDEPAEKAKTKPGKATAAPAAKKGTVTGSPRKTRRDDDDDDDDDDDKPARKKKQGGGAGGAMIAIIAAGALGLAALVGGGIYFLTGSDDKPAESAAAPADTPAPAPAKPAGNPAPVIPPPGGNVNPMPPGGVKPPDDANPIASFMAGKSVGTPGGWRLYDSPDGYSVDLPGTPEPFTDIDKTDASVTKAQVVGPAGKYVVIAGTVRPGPAVLAQTAGDSVKLLAVAVKEVSKEGAPAGAKPVIVGGHPGTSFSSPGIPVANGCVLVAAKDRVFMVMWLARDAEGQAAGKRAADSLKITYKPDLVAGGPGTVPPMPQEPPSPEPPVEPGPGTGTMPPVGPLPTPGTGGNPAPGDGNGNLKAKIDPFYTAAFDTEKKEVYTVDARPIDARRTGGYLRRYSYPDFKALNRFKLPQMGVRAAVDSKGGLLYLATVTSPGAAQSQAQMDNASAIGDIAVYDLNAVRDGKVEEGDDLKPVATVSLRSTIHAVELSADAKTLYVLITNTGVKKSQLVVVDTETRKEVQAAGKRKDLPEFARDMAKAGDGKNLFIAEEYTAKNKRPGVMEFDTAAMSLLSPTSFPGGVLDLAPRAGGGAVVSVLPAAQPPAGGIGQPAGGGGPASKDFKLFLLDANGGTEMNLGAGAHASNGGYIEFAPDNKRLFASSWHGQGLDVYEVTDAAAATGLKLKSAVKTAGGTPVGGHFFITPDGKALVFHNGAVMDPDNLGGGAPGAGNTGTGNAGGGP